MQNLAQELELLRQKDEFRQAVDNVLMDIRSDSNPHGNLTSGLVAALDRCWDGSRPLEKVVEDHRCLRQPFLHQTAPPQPHLFRAMALSTFITYQMLDAQEEDGASFLADVDPWLERFSSPGLYQLPTSELSGRTAATGRLCWWSFEEPHRPISTDGETFLQELALPVDELQKAELDGAAVAVNMDGTTLGRLFKPTALEGFEEHTLFRPELTGAPYGQTVPVAPDCEGRPELVGFSKAYRDLRGEIVVHVLPFHTS